MLATELVATDKDAEFPAFRAVAVVPAVSPAE
jgi:hypothetical protein